MGEDSLLKKITKDCGHSHTPNPDCRLEEIKDPSDKVILPNKDLLDITGKFMSQSDLMVSDDLIGDDCTLT